MISPVSIFLNQVDTMIKILSSAIGASFVLLALQGCDKDNSGNDKNNENQTKSTGEKPPGGLLAGSPIGDSPNGSATESLAGASPEASMLRPENH